MDEQSEERNEKWFLRKIIKKNPISNSNLENDSGGKTIMDYTISKSELEDIKQATRLWIVACGFGL
jgi:hypothetical protein